MTHKYPDWKDDEYNCGEMKFVWGVKSFDDLSSAPACMHTLNDIDIIYDRKHKDYYLGIETAYIFTNKLAEVEYVNKLLAVFTDFMEKNNYDTNQSYCFFMNNFNMELKAKSIPELYTMFRIVVEGYKAVYGGKDNA